MNEVVMKAVALVETTETENPNGAFDVILSAPTLDRDGEVIDARAFDPLPDHIPFDIDHSMTVTGTVGSGAPYYDADGTLRVKGTFASTLLGQEVRTLVSEGHIRTTSVTFMAAKRVKDDTGVDHIQTAELLNGTFTPVPSNRESVVLSAKALSAAADEKVGARNSAKDSANIQAAHDAMVSLGAYCDGKSHTPSDVKTPDPKNDDESADAPVVEVNVDASTAVDAGESSDASAPEAAEAADGTEKSVDPADAALLRLIDQRSLFLS